MTPGEVHLRAFCYFRGLTIAEKSAWKREAHFTAMLLNASGKSLKRKVKAKDLYRFKDDGDDLPGKGGKPGVTGDVRRLQMLETLKIQKAKCWGKISDAKLAEFAASVTSASGDNQ